MPVAGAMAEMAAPLVEKGLQKLVEKGVEKATENVLPKLAEHILGGDQGQAQEGDANV